MRHHFVLRGARPAALLSMSLLLAFAFLPALAQAEDGSGVQYSSAPPSPTGLTPAHPQSPAHSSTMGGGASNSGKGRKAAKGGGKASKGKSSSKAGKGGGSGLGGGNGQGSPGKGTGGERPVQIGEPTSSSGGSSPLVPILIAIAVLAAISIGVVVFRRNRAGGSAVSPKAN